MTTTTAHTSSFEKSRYTLARFTLERLAYALLIVIPTVIRLVNLGGRTLSPHEARTALRAWQTSQGLHPLLDAGIPLLFSLQSLTFFVAGANDALARIWPLLAAALLPLAFYLLRDWLGRWPALVAAMLITLSPTINAFARRADGVSFALLGLLMALAGWSLLAKEPPRGWPLLTAGVAIALLSGPAGVTSLIALGIILLLTPRRFPPPRSRDWAIFTGILLTGGAAFFTRFDSLGLIAINLGQWLDHLTFVPRAWLLGFIHLAADEPLISLFGAFAIVWGMLQGGKVRAWSIAAAIAALIAIAQGSDVAYSRAVAALLLSLPAATFLVAAALHGNLHVDSLEQTLFVIVLILLAFLTIFALVTYAHTGEFTNVLLLAITQLMFLTITGVFIWFIGWREVRNGLLITALTLTTLFAAGMVWQLGFNSTLPTLARIHPAETLPDAKDLVRTYGDISERQTGDRWAAEVILIPGSRSDDVLQWYMRRSEDFSISDGVNDQQSPTIVIAPADSELALSGDYAGQRFFTLTDWDIGQLEDAKQIIHWFFFRRAPVPPPAIDAVDLWASLDLTGPGQGK